MTKNMKSYPWHIFYKCAREVAFYMDNILSDESGMNRNGVMEEQSCREIKVSEEYADFIVEYEIPSDIVIKRYGAVCHQPLDVVYSAVYVPLSEVDELSILNYPYK